MVTPTISSRAASVAARRQICSETIVRCRITKPSSRNFSNSQAAAQTKRSQQKEEGLSTLGTLFFGSLCASTFGLGVWQSQRYFEKIDQVEQRDIELAADPVELDRFTVDTEEDTEANGNASAGTSYRRLTTSGKFLHEKEVLVGPRGPPPGALASTGPSSGRSSGGMASSPQVCKS